MISLRHISRSLLRNRSYTLAATLTMAVGLAATTAVVAVANAVLLRPLPYPRPDGLYRLNASNDPTSLQTFALSPIEVARLQQQAKTLEQVEAMTSTEMALSIGGTPETLKVGAASAGFLRMFGLQSTTGRDFTAEEDAQRLAVAVLDGGTWIRRFGSDPNVIGQTIRLDGTPYVVIGVTP